jgi:hypothetical protein
MSADGQTHSIGTVSDLLTLAGCVILVLALYAVLAPINRNVMLLAVCFRFAEWIVLAAIGVMHS